MASDYDSGADYGDYLYDIDYLYTNPLDEISTLSKVIISVIVVGACVLVCCCYCCCRCLCICCSLVARRMKYRCLELTDKCCCRDPGLDPPPNYEEYLSIKGSLAQSPEFQGIVTYT